MWRGLHQASFFFLDLDLHAHAHHVFSEAGRSPETMVFNIFTLDAPLTLISGAAVHPVATSSAAFGPLEALPCRAEVMDFVLLYFWKCVYTELQSEGAMEVKIARFFLRYLIDGLSHEHPDFVCNFLNSQIGA